MEAELDSYAVAEHSLIRRPREICDVYYERAADATVFRAALDTPHACGEFQTDAERLDDTTAVQGTMSGRQRVQVGLFSHGGGQHRTLCTLRCGEGVSP